MFIRLAKGLLMLCCGVLCFFHVSSTAANPLKRELQLLKPGVSAFRSCPRNLMMPTFARYSSAVYSRSYRSNGTTTVKKEPTLPQEKQSKHTQEKHTDLYATLEDQLKQLHEGKKYPYRPLTGKGIKIAVIDSGIDENHPDFKGRIIEKYNLSSLDDQVEDEFGHGTHVAGIIRQVAPESSLMIYASDYMIDYDESYYEAISGIKRAVEDGAHLINLSFVFSRPFTESMDQVVRFATKRGVVVVAAAGNNPHVEMGSPASCTDAITVGNHDPAGNIVENSSMGHISGLCTLKPDIVAPGWCISSSFPRKLRWRGTKRMSGTSMSAPFVTGAAALIKQRHPEWTAEEIKSAISNTAVPLTLPTGQYSGIDQGAGRMDIQSALNTETLALPNSLFFGKGELRRDQLLKGQLTLKNMSNHTQVYTIRVAMDDDVVNHFEEEIPCSIEVGAHSAKTFPVVFKVKKEIPEKVIDGVLTIQGDSDTLRVPFIIVSGNPSTFPQQDNND